MVRLKQGISLKLSMNYDKAEQSTISDKTIRQLLQEAGIE